jgi:hypothetical protein
VGGACRSAFNEYLRCVDGGFTEALLAVFAATRAGD